MHVWMLNLKCLHKLILQSTQKVSVIVAYCKSRLNNFMPSHLERISSNLTTLKSAHISNVLGLTSVPEQLFCTSLQSLRIEDCEELSYIPDTSQPLISLEELTIYDCLGELCFLTTLRIEDCSNITCLPEGSLKCLRSWMFSLVSISSNTLIRNSNF